MSTYFTKNKKLLEVAEKIQQNGFANTNSGFLNGNLGISIFFYHLAKEINSNSYEELADNLLNKVYTSINNSLSPDFENGLAGIGYGIEYLIQNNFAEGKTDEILEEIDNIIFRILNDSSQTSFELTNGLTGYLYYINSRLKQRTNPPSMAWRINRELLILIQCRLVSKSS